MITIITGPPGSGKTTKLISLYNKGKRGDGIALHKYFWREHYAGQEIVRLSTKETLPFSRKSPYLPQVWDECARLRDYSFSEKGIAFGKEVLNQLIKSPANPVFVDEIGPLELAGQGLYPTFCTLLSRRKDMIVTVRDSCLEDFLMKFEIIHYRLYE